MTHARATHGWGERGYSLYERTTIRPALNVTGITGGHQGAGGKSIVPARALAKIDIRLVPDQDPAEIERLFRAHVCDLTPPAVRSEVRTFFRTKPAVVDRNHPAMRAAVAAYRQGFGVAPVFVRSGGSIPVVNEFQELLGVPTVLMGFALPDDRIHAANEKFHLPNFFKGIATCIAFLREVSGRLIALARSSRRGVKFAQTFNRVFRLLKELAHQNLHLRSTLMADKADDRERGYIVIALTESAERNIKTVK